MESLLLPSKITYHETEKVNTGVFVIEPFYYGFGTTIGNALRRVLLSSLPGAAVTAVKISGVQHEFSTLPHVKEDVLEILLNFKMIRLKMFSDTPITLHLSVKGEKEVTPKNIEKSASLEIVNTDLHIATLTDSKAIFEADVTFASGRGYVPTETRSKEKLPIGCLSIDSIFTPIVNVGYEVDATRVGQITNFDRLTLTIETDGTLTPQEAFSEAVDILLSHFNLLKDYEGRGSSSEESEVVQENSNLGSEEIKEEEGGKE
jgi:DNA-directed RNA polymerase subunit alpha